MVDLRQQVTVLDMNEGHTPANQALVDGDADGRASACAEAWSWPKPSSMAPPRLSSVKVRSCIMRVVAGLIRRSSWPSQRQLQELDGVLAAPVICGFAGKR